MLRSIKRSDDGEGATRGPKRARKALPRKGKTLSLLLSFLLVALPSVTFLWKFGFPFETVQNAENLDRSSSLVCSTTNATVLGLAAGYDLKVLRLFVGSLRNTGYCGHVILGVAPDVSDVVLEYLHQQRVTVQRLEWTRCDYRYNLETIVCAKPYSNLKVRWGRFPLARDWLQECRACSGPIMVTDVRDVVFQRDPFDGIVIKGLQLFAEHPYQTTLHKLVKKPIRRCKHMKLQEPMLCSGTTVGTREAILAYLETMYRELVEWAGQDDCRLINREGGDQAIHNYIYYTGKLPASTEVIPFRSSGVVNTVAVWGKLLEEQLRNHTDITWDRLWEFNVTDRQGYFLENDGSRSRTVHQFDRFNWAGYNVWLQEHFWVDRTIML